MMLQTEHGLEVGLFVEEQKQEKPVEAPATKAPAAKTTARKASAKK